MRDRAVVARQSHKLEVIGSIPIPATNIKGEDHAHHRNDPTIPCAAALCGKASRAAEPASGLLAGETVSERT